MSIPSDISFATPSVSSDVTSNDFSVTCSKKVISRVLVTVFHEQPSLEAIHPETYYGEYWMNYVQVWSAQWEVCPTTGTSHAHIYIEFRNSKRPSPSVLLSTISKVSPRNNMKFAKKANKNQRQGAVNYVSKEETRIPDAPTFRWSDMININYDEEFATKRAKKSEKEKIIEFLMSHPYDMPYEEILHESEESRLLLCSCSWSKKFHEARRAKECERRTINEIVILYGVGGSGKTTYARNYLKNDIIEDDKRYYRRNYDDGRFWGGGATGYKNQAVIHLDEFNGQEKLSDFKEICDVGHVGKPINVKNSGGVLNHSTVIITSNVHPVYWYYNVMSRDDNMWEPFYRRITKVLFFPTHTPSGKANKPTSDTELHFIDQTIDWNTNCGTFEKALEHAQSYWPRNEHQSNDAVWTYNHKEGQWLINGNIPTAQELRSRPI